MQNSQLIDCATACPPIGVTCTQDDAEGGTWAAHVWRGNQQFASKLVGIRDDAIQEQGAMLRACFPVAEGSEVNQCGWQETPVRRCQSSQSVSTFDGITATHFRALLSGPGVSPEPPFHRSICNAQSLQEVFARCGPLLV